jgi:predicted metalloprotease with PDZ domain
MMRIDEAVGRRVTALLVVLIVPFATSVGATSPPTLTLAVDASEAQRGILHARLIVPATPGPLTLVYPKWLPGEHGPTGPVRDLVGLALSAAGRPVPWFRDTLDMYAFHCTVPSGAQTVEARYDFLLPAGGNFSGGVSSTQQLALVSWNQVLLYPQGVASNGVQVAASLRLPDGWRFGTALPVKSERPGEIRFATTSLTTLVDSPVLAGAYFGSVRLNPGAEPAVFLDMAADGREALDIPAARLSALQRLVGEAGALFGARHYRDYHFLLTLSDHTAHFGLEHHESSDDRVLERTLLDDDLWLYNSNLLPHEYVHSWNGKYRRPAGLATADFQQPMRGELLWVYEGLTQYLGFVLAARSGVRDLASARDALAYAAAQQELHRGRQWRPLLDTAVAAQILYGASDAWESWRRGTDFYNEGILLWLEADALIRRGSGGSRSLDDFCRRFHGGAAGGPVVMPYAYDDVIAALDGTAHQDWRPFFDEHLQATGPHAPLAGLEACGWRLGWADTLSAFEKAIESCAKRTEMQYSIGVMLSEAGDVIDVIPGSAAARAGMAPGMKLLAVDGRRYTPKVLRAAVRAGKGAAQPLELLATHTDYYRTFRLDYHGGEKYPVLDRLSGRPDLLAAILAPRVEGATK